MAANGAGNVDGPEQTGATRGRHGEEKENTMSDATKAQSTPTTPSNQNGPKTVKKPIWKKWWFWVIVVVALFIIIGSSGESNKEAEQPVKVPNVVGMPLDDAEEALKEAGFSKVTAKSASGSTAYDGTVKEQDPAADHSAEKKTSITLTVQTESDKRKEEREQAQKQAQEASTLAKNVEGMEALEAIDKLKEAGVMGTLAAFNDTEMDVDRLKLDKEEGVDWLVTSAKVSSGKVNLIINTRKNVQANLEAEQREKALEAKLSTNAALSACRAYGKEQYPYGFKTHDILGVIQNFTPSDDNTWFYKATVDVTNAFGATAKDQTYECYVTGTTDNPVVTEFNVY